MSEIKAVGVTSVAFCQNKYLCDIIASSFTKVIFNPLGKRLSRSELIETYKNCEALVVGLDKIDAQILRELPMLKQISKYGVGLDNIDLSACKEAGVEVLYEKGVNRRSVSELTLGFILGHLRNIIISDSKLKSGIWEKKGGVQLSGKTVGIIGTGNIGKDMVALLQPFGCRVLCNDILDIEKYCAENNAESVSKEEIFSSADIISIHVPLTSGTKHMINSTSISKMKDTVFIVNTARGGIVDYVALKNAVRAGKVAGAALDVFDEEPFFDEELRNIDNIYCTPHIGGNAYEAVVAMGEAAIRLLLKK